MNRLLLASLLLGPTWVLAGEEPREKGGERKEEKERQVRARPQGEKPPPERVELPGAGLQPAEDLLALAGVLSGRSVRLDGDRVRETKVLVSEDIAGSKVTLEELAVLLAAHRLYLFEVTDPDEGEILVASRNPHWKNEPPRYTKIIEVGAGSFDAAWKRIQSAVEEANKEIGGTAAAVFALPDARTGKVVVGASSKDALAKVLELLEKRGLGAKDSDRPRLYTYTGKFRKAEDLSKALLEGLSDGEKNQLRITVASSGNRLFFRAPPSVWQKVEEKLKEIDKGKFKAGF